MYRFGYNFGYDMSVAYTIGILLDMKTFVLKCVLLWYEYVLIWVFVKTLVSILWIVHVSMKFFNPYTTLVLWECYETTSYFGYRKYRFRYHSYEMEVVFHLKGFRPVTWPIENVYFMFPLSYDSASVYPFTGLFAQPYSLLFFLCGRYSRGSPGWVKSIVRMP